MSIFILTVNPEKLGPGWESLKWDERLEAGLAPAVPVWTTGNRRSGIAPGDDLFLLLQGQHERGIIAHYAAVSEIYQDQHWREPTRQANYVDIEVMSAVRIADRIPTEDLMAITPQVDWRYLMSSGVQVPEGDETEFLDAILSEWMERDFLIISPQADDLANYSEFTLRVLAAEAGLDADLSREALEAAICSDLRQLPASPEASDVAVPADDTPADRQPCGHLTDPIRRNAVEQHAMKKAAAWLAEQGFTDVADVSATSSWDLEGYHRGVTIPVEVKGSTGTRSTVDVTAQEVAHAHRVPTLLIVIDQIICNELNRCTQGRLHTEWPWKPEPSRLDPTAYRYTLTGDDIGDSAA